MATSLRAYDRTGALLGRVPWSALSRTVVRNAPGSLTAEVPRSLLDAELLDQPEVYLRVVENGAESPDWYLLDDDGDDDASDGGQARPVSLGAKGVLVCLGWAEVYPYDHVPGQSLYNLRPDFGFVSATPGRILSTLIDKAKARGAIPAVSYSFTANADSAGRPWPTTYSRTYPIGDTVEKVLTQMGEDAWADYEMVGLRLDLYVPDTTLGADRPDVVIRRGKAVTSGPRKRTRASVRSVLLAAGAEGAIIEIADAAALSRVGRREGYEGRSGVTDVGTLTAATQVSLARQTDASESITLTMDTAEAPALPRPGAFVRYDQRRLSASALEPLRLQSVAWQYGESPQVSVELADLWVDQDVRLERRVNAILGGSSANERVPQPPADTDEVPPGPVLGLAVASAPYVDSQGVLQAQVTASWVQVAEDADGSVVDDLAGYRVEWRLPEFATYQGPVEPGNPDADSSPIGQFTRSFEVHAITLTTWSPVPPDTSIEVRIQARDRWGNTGVWSDWVVTRTGKDETAPPPPADPLVDNYLGLLRVEWPGGAAGGQPMPPDLARVEVYVGDSADFTVGAGTYVGTMTTPGPLFAEVPYGATRWAKLVAVDTTGNVSAASVAVSGTSVPVVGADILDGAVGSLKLADLAVVTAKIGDLAVNNAKIGSVDVGKITTGVLNAQVTLSGRIATAMTGTRTEMNASGFYRWQGAPGSEVQMVAIDASGALITGRYRTAVSGRRIEFGSAAGLSQLDLWGIGSGSADRAFVRSYTSHTGYETVQIGVGDPAATSTGGYGEARISLVNTGLHTNGTSLGLFDTRFTDYAISYGRSVAFFDASSSSGYDAFRLDGESNTATFIQDNFQVKSLTNQTVRMLFDRFGNFSVEYGNRNRGTLSGSESAITSSSPQLRLLASSGVGAMIQTLTSGGTWTEFRDHSNGIFTGIRVGGLDNQSDAASKRGIELFDRDRGGTFTERVRRTPVRRYRRLISADGEVGPTEIGLIAQEAPREMVNAASDGLLGIGLYQMSTVLWGAQQETTDAIAAVRGELGALRQELARAGGGSRP